MKDLIKKITPNFILNFYHFLLAFFGAILYQFPSRKLKVIGVTGTNGKTTTTEMISQILEEGGYKVALMNSIRFKIGQKEEINTLRMTMPGRFFIQRFLRKAANSGCQYAVLEVTSEGIKQHRHRFIKFDVAVFTNLAPEHIESHGSFEKYREAKGKLFWSTKNIHIINLDDKNADYFFHFPSREKFLYQIKNGELKVKFLSSTVCVPLKIPKINLKLSGNFNYYNALAAICVGLSQKIDLGICKKILEEIEQIPGRMEEVVSKPFKVIVDYAFTPDALEKVYSTLANLHEFTTNNTNIREIRGQIREHSRLICVLGACGGGRDKWKRPVLGKIAAKYCDEVIITNEDPHDEDPMEIINQVANGAGFGAKKILERRGAISQALQLAKENDIVIITGKGCEPSICLAGGKRMPWDDRRVVKEELERLKIPLAP